MPKNTPQIPRNTNYTPFSSSRPFTPLEIRKLTRAGYSPAEIQAYYDADANTLTRIVKAEISFEQWWHEQPKTVKIIDIDVFEDIAMAQLTDKQLFLKLGVTPEEFEEWAAIVYGKTLSEIIVDLWQLGQANAKIMQYEKAVKSGNVQAMTYWGKNFIGQSDTPKMDEIMVKRLEIDNLRYELDREKFAHQKETSGTLTEVPEVFCDITRGMQAMFAAAGQARKTD